MCWQKFWKIRARTSASIFFNFRSYDNESIEIENSFKNYNFQPFEDNQSDFGHIIKTGASPDIKFKSMPVFKINRENYNLITNDNVIELIKCDDSSSKIVVNVPEIKKVVNTYDGFKGGVIQLNLSDNKNIELFTYDEVDYKNLLDKVNKN